MTDTGDTHALEVVMKQGHQSLTDDFVFFAILLAPVALWRLKTEFQTRLTNKPVRIL